MSGALGIDGHGIEHRVCHLAGQEPAPDQLIQPVLVRGQAALYPFGVQLRMGGTDGLVGILGPGLGLIDMVLSIVIALTVALTDQGGGGIHGLIAEAQGVGTHIGNETQGAFALHVHALIKLLGNHHGALGGHIQLSGGLLLQGRGGEGRRCGALFLRLLHIGDGEFLPGDVIDDGLGLLFIFQLPPLLLAVVVGDKAAGLAPAVQGHIQRPVLLGLEGADLIFPVHHHSGGDGLDASGGQTPAHLLPQQRGQLIAHDPVQNPSGLLGIHQVIVDVPGMLDGFSHHPLGDLIEGYPVRLFVGQPQQFLQMPGDGFSLPVRVGCEVDGLCLVGCRPQLPDQLFLAPDGDIFRRKIMLQIHAHFALGQVTKMAHAGLDNVVRAKIFANGLRLGG